MTEAALAGELDILFAGAQPAVTLISRSPDWRIVGRMVNYRSALLVPVNSSVKDVSELRGKKIATAVGSTTHRDAIRILTEAGLDLKKDFKVVNLDQAEHAEFIRRAKGGSWGDVAAVATYDPTIAVTVQAGVARVLKEWSSRGVVVVRKAVIDSRRDDVERFLQSYIQAYTIYAGDPDRFDKLYEADSRLPLPPSVYRTMAAYEPNLHARTTSEVQISIDGQRREAMQRDEDVAASAGIIPRKIQVDEFIDPQLAEDARRLKR